MTYSPKKLVIIFSFIALFGIRFTATAVASDAVAIQWDIKGGQYVDKAQAQRIFDAAQEWVGDHLSLDRMPRTTLTIHVGDVCPDKDLKGPCLSPASSELYLRTWDETSPSAVAHAALFAALTQLLDRDE